MKKSSFCGDKSYGVAAADGYRCQSCCGGDGWSGDGDDYCDLCLYPDCYNKAATNPLIGCGGVVAGNHSLSLQLAGKRIFYGVAMAECYCVIAVIQ